MGRGLASEGWIHLGSYSATAAASQLTTVAVALDSQSLVTA